MGHNGNGRPAPPLDFRLGAAVAAAKLTATGIRRLGRGGGTAAPGLVADRIDAGLVTKLARQLPGGAIVVAGTNGKTTVSRMLADILTADGRRVVHNRSGTNLLRGVAAAFAAQSSLRGSLNGDIAVIESDEAAFPAIVRQTQPRLIVLNNLFRDQLDRYGELHAIAARWQPVLTELPATTTLVVNFDDPTLCAITENIAARRIGFGLTANAYQLQAVPHAADATVCPNCGTPLTYRALYLSHLGDWHCPGCGRQRPPLDVAGQEVQLDGVEALRVAVSLPTGDLLNVAVTIPGLYNVYNVVAATAAANSLGVPDRTITHALGAYRAAFGRMERVTIDGRTITLALVKNPVGCNEVLRMLTTETGGLTVPTLIAINDRDADGRDVSWLWDVDFELLADGAAPLCTTGIRGPDMANRLKYAGVALDRITSLPCDLATALDTFVASIPQGGIGYALVTYTALLDLRQILASCGIVETFWEQ